MVLFTSRSLPTWGEPLDALPGISLRYLSAIYFQLTISLFLLQTSHNDRAYFLLTKSRPMEKRDGCNVGGHQHLPFAVMVLNSLPFPQQNCPPWTASRLGGQAESLPCHCLPVGTSRGGSYRGQEIWSINCMGKPLSGQGPLHGGSGWKTDCLGLQWTWLALHLGAITWGHPPCTTP